jgi:hypothetical protein
MFFDQLDERDAMVQSILTFVKVDKTDLADLGSRLSRFHLNEPLENCFLRPGSKCDDPIVLSGHLDNRNMMEKSIIHTGHF